MQPERKRYARARACVCVCVCVCGFAWVHLVAWLRALLQDLRKAADVWKRVEADAVLYEAVDAAVPELVRLTISSSRQGFAPQRHPTLLTLSP